jgi:hypothetical protein
MLGEVPIRDFMAYDLGRYYWSAAVMSLMGDNGITALRIAVAVFQALGLFLALLLLTRSSPRSNPLVLGLALGTMLLWMYPRHKLFDITLSISLIAALAYLIEQPSARRYFIAGMLVGMIAVFGRNHGLYGAIGGLGVIAYLESFGDKKSRLLSALKWWGGGIAIGYLPVLLYLLFVPGFAIAFWEGIRFLFEIRGTNLALPVPWPWQIPFAKILQPDALPAALVGTLFICILAFGVLGIGHAMRAKVRKDELPPVLVATAFLALPYAHYAFSRADAGHLAQGIFPFLIGGFTLLARRSTRIGIPGAALLFIASVLVMLPLHPGWQSSLAGNWKEYRVAADTLRIGPDSTRELDLLNGLVGQYATGGESFIATPFWPGAYAVFDRKAPIWEIYALFPRSVDFQKAEIKRIETAKPTLAVVIDVALDGRDELRFRNTHSVTEQYIRDNFDYLKEEPTAGGRLQIYKSKQIDQ